LQDIANPIFNPNKIKKCLVTFYQKKGKRKESLASLFKIVHKTQEMISMKDTNPKYA
jgi:hypothetical protein